MCCTGLGSPSIFFAHLAQLLALGVDPLLVFHESRQQCLAMFLLFVQSLRPLHMARIKDVAALDGIDHDALCSCHRAEEDEMCFFIPSEGFFLSGLCAHLMADADRKKDKKHF